MEYLSVKTGGVKFISGWLAVFLIRLIPFRPPNFEPMLATVMPFAKRYNVFVSFLFGFIGITIFDFASGKVGMWTLITASAYGLLGAGAYFFFKKRTSSIKNYLTFGIIGTIVYDAATGLSIGPLFFGQPFMDALVGQIPFTLIHLLGTAVFAVLLSPALYRWVVTNEIMEIPALVGKLRALGRV